MSRIATTAILLIGLHIWILKPIIVYTEVMGIAESTEAPMAVIKHVVPIYDIGLSEEWSKLVWEECQARDVEYELALAVMMVENRGFNPSLISGTNDYGLFQVNKVNHKRMAELGYTNMLDAEDNIRAGVYILSECLSTSDSYTEALMVYNMGRGGANRAMAKGIYNTKYSDKVMSYYYDLKGDIYGKI